LWVASGTETSASACSAASGSSTGTAWATKRLCLISTACVAVVASVCRLTGARSLRQQRAQVLGQLGLRIAVLVFAQAVACGVGLAFGEQLAHPLQPGLPYLRRVGRGRRLVLERLVDRGHVVEGVDAGAGDLDPVERAGVGGRGGAGRSRGPGRRAGGDLR